MADGRMARWRPARGNDAHVHALLLEHRACGIPPAMRNWLTRKEGLPPYAPGRPGTLSFRSFRLGLVDERGCARPRPAAAAAGGGCGSDAARGICGGLPRLAVRH